MSSGGTISAMVASIKNNTRAKRKNYFKKYDEDAQRIFKQPSVKSKKESLKRLAIIRKRLIKENVIEMKWRIITISVFLIFFMAFIYFFKDLLIN